MATSASESRTIPILRPLPASKLIILKYLKGEIRLRMFRRSVMSVILDTKYATNSIPVAREPEDFGFFIKAASAAPRDRKIS